MTRDTQRANQEDLQRACVQLEVFVDGRPVGLIEQHNNDFTFQYYPNTDASNIVSLLMPVRARPYPGAAPGLLAPVFDMNLPEGSLRRALVGRYSKVVSGFNDLALLALVGRNTVGRLTFGAHAGEQPVLDVDALMHSHNADELLMQLYQSDAVFSGIAGAQPKVIAEIDEVTVAKFSDHDAPGQDLRGTFRSDSVIVKTSGREFPWLAANEFYCLRAATLSGLEVPQTRLFRNGQMLVVSRFDRRTHGQGQSALIAAEDFCSLAGLPSLGKYDSSYERIARTINTFDSQHNLVQDKEIFFRSLVLNCVLRNGDAHLKNYSVLYDFGRDASSPNVRLSPMYDVVTTNAYLSADMLALTLDGSKRYPTRKKLERFAARHLAMLAPAIDRVFDQVISGVEAAEKELRGYGQRYPAFHRDVGEKMLVCWQQGLASVTASKVKP